MEPTEDDDRTLWEILQDFGISINTTPFNWKFFYDVQSDCAWSFKLGPVGITIWFY